MIPIPGTITDPRATRALAQPDTDDEPEATVVQFEYGGIRRIVLVQSTPEGRNGPYVHGIELLKGNTPSGAEKSYRPEGIQNLLFVRRDGVERVASAT